MTDGGNAVTRRDFLRRSAGGFALGSLLGLGLDLRSVRAEVKRLKIRSGREVPSICPYCAVGCGQIVTADKKSGQIVNIEGDPDNPINRGTLCPKGAATYQLVVNPLRAKQVLYRAAGATQWEKKPLDWAMEQIAQRVKKTRDASFQKTWATNDADGNPIEKRINQTPAIASLGGATMDNEWNYLQCKLMRSLGVVYLENQARI